MAIITYDGDEFKSIDCIPEYSAWPTIYVAKTPHVDDKGRSYQVINTAWGIGKKVHPVVSSRMPNGYLIAHLPIINGKPLYAYVHRLVLLTWLDELPSNYQKLEVNHRDETRDNNCFTNLELISHQQNLNHGSRTQRMADTLVKYGPSAKMVAININTRQEFHFGNGTECARYLGLQEPHVSHCLLGERRQHKGYVFCQQDDYSPAKVDELIARATRAKTKN